MLQSNDFRLAPGFCLFNKIVPLNASNKKLELGFVNFNEELEKKIQKAASRKNMNVSFKEISQKEFSEKIGKVFSLDYYEKKIDDVKENNFIAYEENEAKALLESLIAKGRTVDATDIHIESGSVRFRIKGKLHSEMDLDRDLESALIHRIKLISKMNVLEKRRCQDGSFVYTDENKEKVFVRVSSLPAVSSTAVEGNESIVMRLLDEKRVPLNIEMLGFDKDMENKIKRLCKLKDGLVLICGATGSGKSTTACSILNEIIRENGFEKKIISLEDPPEYFVEGVTQIHITPDINMDFGQVLRSVFRQDPDVLFVGEIRDKETAMVTIQAALTGHLVFATMHAFSLNASKSRLFELGIDSKIVDEVLRSVILQEMNHGVVNGSIHVIDKEINL